VFCLVAVDLGTVAGHKAGMGAGGAYPGHLYTFLIWDGRMLSHSTMTL
jgi:hypothetical protein